MTAPVVVATVPARIHVLRAQGGAIGWLAGQCHRAQVLIRGRVVTLGDFSPEGCYSEYLPKFAVAANGTGIWVGSHSGNELYADVMTRDYFNEVTGDAGGPSGDYVGGVAAASGRLFYSVLSLTENDACVGAGGVCKQWVAGGVVREVRGKRGIPVRGLPPALMLAGGGDRLAVVVAAHDIPQSAAFPASSGEVDVYALPGFRRVASVTVDEPIVDVAVSNSALAVLTPGTVRVGSTTIHVPRDVVRIALSGRHVAYASGNRVYVDGRVVARRPLPPLGVSSSNGRIVWAERARGVSRVYALRVP